VVRERLQLVQLILIRGHHTIKTRSRILTISSHFHLDSQKLLTKLGLDGYQARLRPDYIVDLMHLRAKVQRGALLKVTRTGTTSGGAAVGTVEYHLIPNIAAAWAPELLEEKDLKASTASAMFALKLVEGWHARSIASVHHVRFWRHKGNTRMIPDLDAEFLGWCAEETTNIQLQRDWSSIPIDIVFVTP
jgi:hypothetical protein